MSRPSPFRATAATPSTLVGGSPLWPLCHLNSMPGNTSQLLRNCLGWGWRSDHSIPVLVRAPGWLRSREVTQRWGPSPPVPLLLQLLSRLVHLGDAKVAMASQSCPEPSSTLQPRVRHELLPALADTMVSSRCWVAAWQSRGNSGAGSKQIPTEQEATVPATIKKNTNNQDFSQ